ncbi:MAG: EF-P lysine aminoacylase GenX [Pseudomonadales bacterium]
MTQALWQPSASIAMLQQRARIAAQVRDFFAEREVLEVHTPVLAAHTVTDPHVDAIAAAHGYLQTSPEYAMKRLLAAGAPSIYQLGPAFRAGEAGRLHAPEFTMLEWYRLGFDDAALMQEVSELVDLVLGAAPYQQRPYADLLASSPLPLDHDEDLRVVAALEQLGPVRVFITDYPAARAALARLRPGTEVAARFELVVNGVELANGYHELGDAETLRARFAADNAARETLGKPAMGLDDAFLAAMAHGLPDCAGVALGFDRMAMLALGAQRLSEVMAFGPDAD